MDLSFDLGRGPASYGHRFLIGLQPGHTLGDKDKRLLSLLKPAGVVLFRANFLPDAPYEDWLDNHARLLSDVREYIERDEVIVSIDHEGGGVLRPPAPITAFAYAREWPKQAADVGKAMGVELRSLGFNVNFAPVVDVNSNPANPVIGQRSFGTTPDDVVPAARAFLDAMQAEGVLGCPKHFPRPWRYGRRFALFAAGHRRRSPDLPQPRARGIPPFQRCADADGHDRAHRHFADRSRHPGDDVEGDPAGYPAQGTGL